MPLQQWSCDVCGEPVTSEPNDGIVVWRERRTATGLESHDFKIVHKTIRSARAPRRCDPGAAAGYTSHHDLTLFLGADGLAMLLSWLSIGPIMGGGHPDIAVTDLDQYVDLVRRVQTPYYEEARPRLRDEKTRHWLGDTTGVHPYLPDTLRRIAEGTLGD